MYTTIITRYLKKLRSDNKKIMKYYALICARGGSKGLKNKNLKINNVHLVGHSIKIARSIKKIEKVIVSTDSLEISKVAKNMALKFHL